MKLSNYNNALTLLIDKIGVINNTIRLNILVVLNNKRTDTDIQFKTVSCINMAEWQHVSESLLSDHKLELENFSFHADHKIINVDGQRLENIQNYFTISSRTGNSHLNFTIESRVSFEEMFVDEITRVIQLGTSYDDIIPGCSQEENLIHIALSKIKNYQDLMCSMQLDISSESFHMTRTFENHSGEASWILEQIRQFNDGKKERIEMEGEFLELEFNWVNGRKYGKGSICDFTWPEPNELTFDDYVKIEWKEDV